MADLSVVIPVYQCASCLETLHERLSAVLGTLTPKYEIIYVEDGGNDNSWEILVHLAKADSQVRAYKLHKNYGQYAAIAAGISECTGNWAIVMDGDLQDPPEEIPRLYHTALSGYDMVFARRTRRAHPLWRRLASSCYFYWLRLLRLTVLTGQLGMLSIISRRVIDEYLKSDGKAYGYLTTLTRLPYPAGVIEYEQVQRHSGKSSYTFSKLLKLAYRRLFISAHSSSPARQCPFVIDRRIVNGSESCL